jgi:hypothetical protein
MALLRVGFGAVLLEPNSLFIVKNLVETEGLGEVRGA